MKALYERGANQVVQPEFEAGLEMTRQALLHLQVPATEILRYTDTIRRGTPPSLAIMMHIKESLC